MVVLPVPGYGGAEELRGDPTVVPRPRSGQRSKMEVCAKDGTPERLRCGEIQKEAS